MIKNYRQIGSTNASYLQGLSSGQSEGGGGSTQGCVKRYYFDQIPQLTQINSAEIMDVAVMYHDEIVNEDFSKINVTFSDIPVTAIITRSPYFAKVEKDLLTGLTFAAVKNYYKISESASEIEHRNLYYTSDNVNYVKVPNSAMQFDSDLYFHLHNGFIVMHSDFITNGNYACTKRTTSLDTIYNKLMLRGSTNQYVYDFMGFKNYIFDTSRINLSGYTRSYYVNLTKSEIDGNSWKPFSSSLFNNSGSVPIVDMGNDRYVGIEYRGNISNWTICLFNLTLDGDTIIINGFSSKYSPYFKASSDETLRSLTYVILDPNNLIMSSFETTVKVNIENDVVSYAVIQMPFYGNNGNDVYRFGLRSVAKFNNDIVGLVSEMNVTSTGGETVHFHIFDGDAWSDSIDYVTENINAVFPNSSTNIPIVSNGNHVVSTSPAIINNERGIWYFGYVIVQERETRRFVLIDLPNDVLENWKEVFTE